MNVQTSPKQRYTNNKTVERKRTAKKMRRAKPSNLEATKNQKMALKVEGRVKKRKIVVDYVA